MSALPVATVEWIQKRAHRCVQMLSEISADDVWFGVPEVSRRNRGRHQRERGHDRTMRAACVLVQKFGLSIAQAWPLFLEWNEQCEPPWSEKELLHKLHDAARLRP